MICLVLIIYNLIGSLKVCWSTSENMVAEVILFLQPPHLLQTSFRSCRHKNHRRFKKITNIPIDIESRSSHEVCQTFQISLDQMNPVLKMYCFVNPNDCIHQSTALKTI